MPHCCPQKQQWVFTSFSSAPVCSQPPEGTRFKVGPNCFTRSGRSVGSFAILRNLSFQLPSKGHPVSAQYSCDDIADKRPGNASRPPSDTESRERPARISNRSSATSSRTPGGSGYKQLARPPRPPACRNPLQVARGAGRYERTSQRVGKATS